MTGHSPTFIIPCSLFDILYFHQTMNFLLRFLFISLAVILITWFLFPAHRQELASTIMVGAILGFGNSILHPNLLMRWLPVTIVTVVMLTLLVNAALLYVFDRYLPGFGLINFGILVLTAAVITAVSILQDRILRAD
jgi:uncharacterized membrane protein YvlD (DUF360 family)